MFSKKEYWERRNNGLRGQNYKIPEPKIVKQAPPPTIMYRDENGKIKFGYKSQLKRRTHSPAYTKPNYIHQMLKKDKYGNFVNVPHEVNKTEFRPSHDPVTTNHSRHLRRRIARREARAT